VSHRNITVLVGGLLIGVPIGLVFCLMFLGEATQQELCDGGGTDVSAAGQPALVQFYIGASDRYSLGQDGYAYLAAINYVETSFGTNLSTSSAGAIGWMQFEPDTFKTWGVAVSHPGGTPDPYDPQDAIYSAADYLRASGAPQSWSTAVFAYNHSRAYVTQVQGLAARYSGPNGLQNLRQDIAAAWGGRQPTGLPAPSPTLVSYTAGSASGECCPGATTPTAIDDTAASSFLHGLRAPQRAGFAVVSSGGEILAQDNATMPVPGGSITKAMLLVAFLQRLGERPVPPGAQRQLAAMIEVSDNRAGSWAFAQVGAAGVEAVAHRARMTGFRLDVSDPVYTLGESRVTALDQARLFAQIDRLIPARNRAYAMGLLAHISTADQWGILSSGIAGITASNAGWKPEPGSGWVVNQAAQVSGAGQTLGLAVTSVDDSSQAAGEQVLQTVAADLLSGQASGSPTAGAVSTGGQEGCGELSVDVTPVPGSRAVIMPNGLARPPAQAPQAVQAMVAAGDRINHFDYQYGGGHANPALSDSQSRPQPQGGLTPGDNGTPGYDCSGATAYVLFGGGLGSYFGGPGGAIPASGDFGSFGVPGPGRWVTWYYNGGHVFIAVAGIVFDTGHQFPAAPSTPSTGPRWTIAADVAAQQSADGPFAPQHPAGL
jgi:Transglycosylase SLT domain